MQVPAEHLHLSGYSVGVKGKTARIFYVDGEPSGLRVAEVTSSSVSLAIAVPRNLLAQFKERRPEANRTGAYMLLGDDPEVAGDVMAYIGEAEDLAGRLAQHAKDESKEWWTEAIAFTSSKEKGFHKAHAKHLELALWKLAREAPRVKLMNGSQPSGASLPESDEADMDVAMENAQLLLPALSARAWPMLEPRTGARSADDPLFTFRILDAEARMRRTAQGYLVLKGSTALKRTTPHMSNGYRAKRDALAREGVLVQHPSRDLWLFEADAMFASASAAAAVVNGSREDGLRVWKLADGRPLGEIEAAELGLR